MGLVKNLFVKQTNHTVKSLGKKKNNIIMIIINKYEITKQIIVNVSKQYLSTIKKPSASQF